MRRGGCRDSFTSMWGEEAVATGVCASLTDRDFITSTHRGHGHVIAKGGKTELMMAELYGKATGYCKGKAARCTSPTSTSASSGPTESSGRAADLRRGGVRLQVQENGRRCGLLLRDGASNRGTFHEAMNMASSFKLPVVFVCENNMYGISNYQKHHMNISDIADRAGAYGVPGVSVDGNDVIAVYEAASEAVARARRGDGPSIVECKTWRQRGHFEGDPAKYKDPESRKRGSQRILSRASRPS